MAVTCNNTNLCNMRNIEAFTETSFRHNNTFLDQYFVDA